MPHVHDHHCETAEPGSICDCECAGAKHAILRTEGGVPGAGAVTRRAQKIAQRDHRPAVVNNKAVPKADAPDAPPGRHERGARRKPGGETVRSNQKPARVSPSTAAAIVSARQSLPASADAWRAAALAPADAQTLQLIADARAGGQRNIDQAEADIKALYEKHAQIEAKKIAQSKEGKRGIYGNAEKILETARDIAPHRAWEDPEYNAITMRRDNARAALLSLDHAEKRALAGNHPERDGMKMPAPALNQHLATVLTTGRAFLADAKREIDRTGGPDIADARAALDLQNALSVAKKQAAELWSTGADAEDEGRTIFPKRFTMPDGTIRTLRNSGEALDLNTQLQRQLDEHNATKVKPAQQVIRAHERDTIMTMLAEHRQFGGVTHTNATAAPDPKKVRKEYGETSTRKDWRERLTRAEQYFPADWLRVSAAKPLQVGTSNRAFYNNTENTLSLSAPARDKDAYDGSFADASDEVTVHEFGHRMERMIPGLTALEFAMVRRHATATDGTVEPVRVLPGYDPKAEYPESGQPDDWAEAYTGKTYENYGLDPDLAPWEVFQVGLQDTFGRSSRQFGRKSDPDELQAFVLGALLTL